MRKSKRKNYILQKCPTIDHSILLDNAFTYERKWQIPAINGDRRIPTILPISRQDFHVKGFSRIAKLEERKLIERVSKRRTWKRSKGFIFRLFSILLFLEFFRNDTCLKINFVKLILPEFHLFNLNNLRVFLISIIGNNRNAKWKGSTMNKRYSSILIIEIFLFVFSRKAIGRENWDNKYLISFSQFSNVQLDIRRAYHRYTLPLHHPSTFDSSQRHLTFVHSLPPSPSCVSGQISIHARL